MPIVYNGPGGGGGSGTVQSVTAADTSITVAGTAANPTVKTGTLDVIAADHPPAADWSNNSHKITSLANGTAAQDAAAFGQITGADGWVDDTAETWTFATATTFTVATDLTAKYSKGTRLKLTQSATVKYFVVVASSFAAGSTTVTITGGSDFTFANATVSANFHSYQINPQGYPGWFTYSCAPTGFSGTPTQNSSRFSVVGRACSIYIDVTGTSNATTFTLQLPIAAAKANESVAVPLTDNSANSSTPAMAWVASAGTTLSMSKTMAFNTSGWTAAGTKATQVSMTYEI